MWGLEISPDGATLYSSGQDRSVRVWERGEDLVFVEEERERAMEAQVDRAAESDLREEALLLGGSSEVSGMHGEQVTAAGATAALKNIESVKGGEAIMDALDLTEAELADLQEHTQAMRAAENTEKDSGAAGSSQKRKRPQRNSNPLLLGLSPYKYMMRALRQVKAPDLEQALILLPFSYVTRLISMLIEVRTLVDQRCRDGPLTLLFLCSWRGVAWTSSCARAVQCFCCAATSRRLCTLRVCCLRCWLCGRLSAAPSTSTAS